MTNWEDEARNIEKRVEEFRKVLAERNRSKGYRVPAYITDGAVVPAMVPPKDLNILELTEQDRKFLADCGVGV